MFCVSTSHQPKNAVPVYEAINPELFGTSSAEKVTIKSSNEFYDTLFSGGFVLAWRSSHGLTSQKLPGHLFEAFRFHDRYL